MTRLTVLVDATSDSLLRASVSKNEHAPSRSMAPPCCFGLEMMTAAEKPSGLDVCDDLLFTTRGGVALGHDERLATCACVCSVKLVQKM